MSDLTIVLILGQRKEFFHYVFRWISYAEKNYNQYKIIIADGSGNEEVEKKLFSEKNNKLDYSYYKYPIDETYSSYYSKLDDAIDKVKTEFTVLADDDDFFNHNSLDKSIKFLKDNNDYSTSRGKIGNFNLKSDFSLNAFHIPKNQTSITDNKISDRFITLWEENNMPAFYDVHRSELQKKNFKILKEENFLEPVMVEMLPQFLDVIDGKMHRFNDLYLMRQSGMNHSSHKEYVENNGNVLERLCFGQFSDDLKKWIKVLSVNLSTIETTSEKESYQFIKKNFLNRIEKQMFINSKYNKKNKKIYDIVKSFVPKVYYDYRKKMHLNNNIKKSTFLKTIKNQLEKIEN